MVKAKVPPVEVNKAVDVAFGIPGLYRRGEAAFLYKLARRKGKVVEIGAWMGRTTSILIQASRVWGGEVITIDPFTPMPKPHKQSSPELWRANLRRLGLTPPHLYHVASADAALAIDGPLAMVFIDGDHTCEAVARDLHDWTPKVPLGGIVALHDMFYPTIPGVAEAVTEWWMGHRAEWEFQGLVDFTVAFKRIA